MVRTLRILKWGFPKISGPFLGVFIIGIIMYWGLFLGPYFRKLPNIEPCEERLHRWPS